MRKRFCWLTLIAAILLAGCSNPSKRRSASAARGRGTEPPSGESSTPLRPSGDSPVKGMLAGQVLDKFERRVPKASIQVVELREGGEAAAPIEVWANEEGYFTIRGLDPHSEYQLIARVKEGERLIAGSKYVRPPDPRMVILVSEDYVSPATPAPKLPPAVPAETPKKPKTDEKKTDTKPAVSLDPPQPPRTDGPSPPDSGMRNDSTPEVPGVRTPRPDLRIRTPPLSIPRVTPSESPEKELPPVPLAPAVYSSQPLPVPSCVMLTARQLDNFALADLEGRAWEFKRDRKGRLVLLDFWHSRCPPCLKAIPHMNELHQAYAARGLEVIGIACESAGPADQRARQAQSARSRFDMRYRILMSGNQGALKPCPVETQLGVAAYPTLKLIDERGTVVWESMGLGDRQLYELKLEIERRLPLTR